VKVCDAVITVRCVCVVLARKTGKCKRICCVCITKRSEICGCDSKDKWREKFVVLEIEYVLNSKNHLYTRLKKRASRKKTVLSCWCQKVWFL
jgi:hypothetical protein